MATYVKSTLVKDPSVVVVTFPDSQIIEEKEGFLENCSLVNSEVGIETFGGSAYKVKKKWLEEVNAGNVADREYTQEELEDHLEIDYETDWI